MSGKKLKVNVIAGRGQSSKNGANKNDPYCEVVVLDDQGNKIGKSQQTKVLKSTLDPNWNQLLEFPVGTTFSGLKIRCWDKHKFRSDKFLGQITIKFNTAMLSSTEKIDDWFTLAKRKAKEDVSGDIHLQIQYGDLKEKEKDKGKEEEKPKGIGMTPETPAVDMRVSSNFHTEETNQKLKASTHVVVVEDEEDDGDKDSEEYEKVREGPSQACLEKVHKDDKDVVLTNKNLEITNNSTNYYSVEYAKGNVHVSAGRWYVEVRIQQAGSINIGWCSKNYNPKVSSSENNNFQNNRAYLSIQNNTGNCWWFDGQKQIKQFNTQPGVKYGEYWSNGDIIGCSLDIENKTIQYWKNGKDLGVAFNDVSISGASGSNRMCVLIGASKRAKCQLNFGKETFAYPQTGYNCLHSNLSEKEIEQLSKLFVKYRDLGNQGLLDDAKEKAASSGAPSGETQIEGKESVHGAGMIEFQKDLGIVEDDDPLFLIIAYKLRTESLWEISREEFMNGFTINGCASMEKIKTKAKEWKDELKVNEKEFKLFYNFVFDYLKEDKKILLIDEAVMAWGIVLKDRKWPLFNEFLEFLKAEEKKAISRDAWQLLWHFMNTYPNSLKDYDVNGSWPILFDEFVEWWQVKHK